jgi:hypothetical protein
MPFGMKPDEIVNFPYWILCSIPCSFEGEKSNYGHEKGNASRNDKGKIDLRRLRPRRKQGQRVKTLTEETSLRIPRLDQFVAHFV